MQFKPRRTQRARSIGQKFLDSLLRGQKRRSRRIDKHGARHEPQVTCCVERMEDRALLSATIGNNIDVGDQLRNYRLAIAATAEYTAFFGGQTQALTAIQTFVDDVNSIFESELSIRLDLVSGLSTIFTDAGTDGYSNGNTGAMINENTPILNNVVGVGNYDIGHVFGTTGSGGSGLAGLGVVNSSTSKGRGVSLSANPQGSSWLSLAAHELAHQFGADHTFNADAFGSAVGNREGTNAYEPASGSTLMSYAGISGADNLQVDPNNYLHAASFEQVQTFIAGSGTPNSTTSTGNNVPVVNGGADFTIPAGTPFELTAVGFDADLGDTFTYTWEQLDLGPAMSLPLTDNGSSPLFRSFLPSTDSTRTFPRLPDLVNNVNTAAIGEALPTTTRDLNFRTTVRDGNGGVNSDDVLINVVNTGSPFAVTAPNAAVNWTGGSTQTISWDVAGTTGSGINTSNVAIDLSLDGGLTYPFVLAGSTTNDGSHTLTVPNIDTTEARVRVRGVGNVFFDISDANFTIISNAGAPGVTVVESGGGTSVSEDGVVGGVGVDTYTLALNTVPSGNVEITINGGAQLEVSLDGVNFGATSVLIAANSTAQTLYVRGTDDSLAEGIHLGTVTHMVTATADSNYPVGTLINPVTASIADDELHPVVGVDFDQSGSVSTPENWTKISQTFGGTTSNLIREDGIATSTSLTLGVSGSAGLNASEPSATPVHSPSLEGLDGNHLASDSLTLTWGGLTPGKDYNIYLLTSEWFGSNVLQDVTITAGVTVPSFTQDTGAIGSGMLVNAGLANSGKTLEADALMVQADASGTIQIVVSDVSTGGAGNALLSGAAIQEVGSGTVGFGITQTGGSTEVSESGTSDTFDVVLTTQPTGTVVVDVSSADSGEVSVGTSTLTFTDTNWNVPQTVTVTGVDDVLEDGAQTTTLTLSVNQAMTVDSRFDAVSDRLLDVINVDNEALPLVGVDFDSTGTAPTNWSIITGAFGSTTNNLINEDANATAFDLIVSVAGGSGISNSSSPANLPDHTPSLANIGGVRYSSTSITLTWTDLTPNTEYDLWLFSAWPFGNPVTQTVTVNGGGTNPSPFSMSVSAAGGALLVNDAVASSARNLQDDAVRATANTSGQIQIVVSNAGGDFVALSGAAIQEVLAAPVLLDFGDAPTATQAGGGTFVSDYPVTAAEDGARHTPAGPSLGSERDSEVDGAHSAAADADDTTGSPDDEDGVTFTTSIIASTNASRIGSVNVDLQNADGTSNRLDAWIDFNRDGDWNDPGERILTNYDLGTANGLQSVSFAIPQDTGANVQEGTTFARFRLSTAGSLSVTGAAADGEVEDHAVTIGPSTDAILLEPFDHSGQFSVSEPFFSIGDGSAFFGISDGAGGGDFGPGSPPTPTVPSYTGATGNFLTGMDMDASATGHTAASLPITATWSGLNISGQTGLQFGAEFASFDEGINGDSGRHIEPSDFIRVEVQIDGGGYVNIMEFRGNNTGGTNAAYFSLDTDGDGSGDGTLLTDALRNFTADIVGSGNLLDLRISMSVSDQDEDFAIDNVTVTANNPTGPFVVDTNADESDGDYSAGDFSLREAIERANTHVGADDIQFAAGLSGQTITLTIDQLSVTDDLTITGLGASNLTVSGGNLFRIFDLQHTPDVVIDGLTLSGGRTNAVGQGGGAIRSSGNLQIIDSVVTNSQTIADASDGGGIFQIGGTLTITDSTISNNSTGGANSFGGGISATQGAETIITGSTIDANTTASASGVGGGLLNIGGDVTITESTISNNENTGVGALGGGVVVAAGNLLVERSTISGNETTGGAGGIGFDSNGLTVTATIVNSTVSGNTTTSGFGGGIANFNGTMNIRHSTVTGNSATAGNGSGVASYTDGSALIANTVVLSSIIADNVNSDIDNILSGGGTNTITSSGFNLVGSGNAVSSFSLGSDVTGVSAGLGPLSSNGGPTQTHALLVGSAAIGAGDTTSAQATDQRGAGFSRLVGANVDIGAFELQATNPSVNLSVDNATVMEASGVAKFTATLSEITGQDVTVALTLTGTATPTDDYVFTASQIVISAGSLSGTIDVTAVPDTVDEADETVIVDIDAVTNGTESGSQQSTTTIIDNIAPELTLPSAPATFTEGDAPVLLDPAATVTDPDSANFESGTLTLEITNGATGTDRLAVRNEGTGAGQIGISGNDVTFEGIVIGTFAGGFGAAPLVISFGAASTPAAAEAVLQNVTFENVSETPSTSPREVTAVLTDGDGGVSGIVSQDLIFSFAVSLGNSSFDRGEEVGTDADGNVYVSGYFRGTIDVDPGPGTVNLTSAASNRDEILIVSYDSSGALRWAKQVSANVANQETDLSVDNNGNVYATGLFSGTIDVDPGPGVVNLTASGTDGFILKLDSEGDYVTSGSIGGGRAKIFAESPGNVYLTGSYGGVQDFDPGAGVFNLPDTGGSSQTFILKLDTALSLVWAKATATTSERGSWGEGITVDATGNVHVVGTFNGTTDFDPGTGVLSLSTATTDTFDIDIYVLKLDSSGDLVWVRGWGGVEFDSGEDIVVDSTGNVYTTGYFEVTGGGVVDFDPGAGVHNVTNAGNWDAFVSKLDSTGNFVWAHGVGTGSIDQGRGIDLDSNENVVAGIQFSGTSDFDPSAGTLNRTAVGTWNGAAWGLKPDGSVLFATAFGQSSGTTTPFDVTFDSQDNVLSTGQYSGSGDFDPGPDTVTLSSDGNTDLFVVRLKPDTDSQIVNVVDLLPPVLTLPSAPVTFQVASAPLVIDPSATITDADSADFNTGTLTLEIIEGGTANDILAVRNQGTGPGEVSVSGSDVSFAGTVIGTFAGGAGVSPLTITFNAASTPAAAQAVLRNITFGNMSSTPSKTPRVISAVVTDGDGGESSGSEVALNFEFVIPIGSTGGDSGSSVTHDADGNIYVTGKFQRTIDADPGAGVANLTSASSTRSDIFVASYDSSGDYRWAYGFGGSEHDFGISIIEHGGTIFVAGEFSGTVDFDPGAGVTSLSSRNGDPEGFLVQFDQAGNFISATNTGGTIHGMTTDAAGNLYATGSFVGLHDFDPDTPFVALNAGGSFHDGFVLKYDSTGDFAWVKHLNDSPGNYYTFGNDISLDAAGNIYSVGHFSGTVNFDPGAGTSALSTSTPSDNLNWDAYLLKLDSNGDFVWARNWGADGLDRGNDLAVDSAGDVYLIGSFLETVDFDPGAGVMNLTSTGSEDGFVVKMDSAGDLVWARQVGGAQLERAFGIDLDANDAPVIALQFRDTVDFDPSGNTFELTSAGVSDAAVWMLDGNGDFVQAVNFGGLASTRPLALTIDNEGNVITTGEFQGTVDFDSGPLDNNVTSSGLGDLFVHKLAVVNRETQTVNLVEQPDTSVEIDGAGNLLIRDINGGDSHDTLTLSVNGANLRVHDPNNVLDASTGTTQIDENTVEVPVADITGSTGIVVDTLGGDDTLTINLDGGNFTKTITFAGGTQTTTPNGDSLILTGGGTFADTVFGFVNNSDGSIDITGNATITYTGLEPITSNVNATNVTLNYSNFEETITVTDPGGNRTSVDSTVGEIVTFVNPTASITVNAGGGNDVITVTSLASTFAGAMILDGQGGDDEININADPQADTTLNAEIVNLNAQITGTVTGNATTVNVAATASIQDGINASMSGGTVLVSPGTYNEFVNIDRTLTLQGTTATLGDVVINPTSNVDAIHVDNDAADVTIRNLQLGGNTVNPIVDGLRVISATGTLTVENISIQNAQGNGFHVVDADTVSIDSVVVNASGIDGFSVPDGGGSPSIAITNSTFTNNVDDGIEVYNTDGVVLTNLTVEDNLDDGVNIVGGIFPGFFEFGEAAALTHLSGDDLLFADRSNNFGVMTTDGVASLLGFLDHDSKGLAFDGSNLLSVTAKDAFLRTLDQSDGATLSSVAISLSGETVLGATGLAVNPVDGVVYAMLRLQGRFARELVTLNTTTGVATSIGNTGDGFAALAFNGTGTLYAVTGDGGNVPETLFELNTATAAATTVLELGRGDDGESLAFNPTDGLLYHFSGLDDLAFESIDPSNLTTQDIRLSTDIGPGPNVTITNSSILRNFKGIDIAFVVDITLTSVTMQDNHHGLHVSEAGSLTIDGGSYSSSVTTNILVDDISGRVTLTNVIVDGSTSAPGIQLYGALGLDISGGSVSGNDGVGLLIDAFPTGVTLNGVTVDNNGHSGFDLFNAASVTITGGSFSNNVVSGIDLDDIWRTTLTNVVVNNNGQAGVKTQTVTTALVDGSTISNNNLGINFFDINEVTLSSVVTTGNANHSLIDFVGTVNIDTTSGATVDDVQLNTPGVGGEGFLQLTRAGVPQNVVNFTRLDELDIDFDAGDDTVTVAPHATTVFDLDGGAPTAAPGDLLTYLADGTSTFNFGPSTISTTGKAAILYNDFETTDVVGNAVNLSLSAVAGTEADETVITVTATANGNVFGSQTVEVAVSGTGITAGDYALSNTTITIPDGMTTGFVTFTIRDDTLSEGTETAVLTLSNPSAGIILGPNVSKSVDVTDDDAAALTVSITDAAISENGGTTTGTVSRNTDTTNALTVTLVSNDISEATVIGTVTIAAGQTTSPAFTITAVDDAIVDGTQTVTITAQANAHVDGTDTLDVTDDDAAALTVSITDAAISENGGTTTATVSRNTDTTDALTINLSSNDTGEAGVPATVTILAGQTSATFSITGVDDAIVDGTQTVTITASAAAHADGTDTLDVTDDDAAALTVSITDAAISENGGTTTATVSRNTDTTNALTVTLVSNDTSEATVIGTVTIAAGQTTSPAFTITGVDDAIVDGTQTVTITASAAAHTDGTDTLDVTDDDAAALTVSITDAAISENGGTTTGTVSRNTDTTNALTINLSSNDTGEAGVPATVTIAAGQTTSPAFTITGVDDAIVDGTQTVTITASAAAHADGTDTLDVTDDDAAALTVSITADAISENGGTTTATVSRNTDTTNALTVTLVSDDTSEATVIGSVTIAAGQTTSPAFDITAVDDAIVDGTQTVTITAQANAHVDGTDTLDVTDDDAAALTVSITADAISENGGTTTATVSRNTDTTNALTVTLVSDDTSEATVIGSVIIAAGQTTSPAFDITAVDDAIVDGTQTVTITAQANAHVDGTDTLDVTDDDAAALTVSITADAISENGGTTTATVSRNTDTTNALTVTLVSDDTSEATVIGSVIIAAGQTTSPAFTITGVDDAIVDGTQTVTITASAAAHADGTDTLDVTDDDAAALTVSITDAAISENGGSTTATVSRNTDTTDALTINLSSNDTGEAGVPATVTILAGQTSATFSITGVDDAIVDGTQTVTITASAAAHADGTDTLDVTDDDAAALTVSITDAAISENGGTTTATVSRNTDTTNALTVTLVSNDTSEATVIGTVTIAAGQTTSPAFDITAVDDAIVDGTQTVTITAQANAHVDGTDTLDVTDDDAAALTVSITDAAISENGGTTTATVSRNTDTTDALTINLSSNDTGEAGVPATVTILAGQTSATFSITGVDDAIVDGTQTVTITASAAAHADGTDTLDVTDDDAAALTVSITDAAISENGGTTTGTVSRNTDTTNALTINLSSNDTGEAGVPATVTILAGQTSATFSITGVDDAIVDGTQTVTITASAAAHADGTDTLDVTDDDAAALTVSITDAAISENGGTTTGTVSRNTDTTNALTINLSSNDTGEAGVPATVTILAGQTSATFSITGVDDAIVDGTQTVTITASAAAHTDGTDTLDVTDDDAAALMVSITDAAISENGGTTTGTVSRNTDTTNALTINLSSNDTGEAGVPATVTILAGQTSATFSITGVDDAIVDGTQTVTITASAAAHTDGTDTLDVTDDDAAALTVSITDAAISENGGTTTGTVSRNTDTTNALTINLSSNDTGEAGVPATVTILAGQTSATFSITGVDDAIVDGTQTVTITASAAAHTDGTDTLDVTDDDAAALTVSITDAAISENGGTTTGTVSRNTDTTNALTINLSSNDTGEAGVPATVTILAGQTSATFSITGVDDAIVDGTQTVTITASAAAHADGTDTLDVTDDDAAALTVSITDAAISENGGTTTATVSRNTDTTDALTINLSSNDTGEAGVPATVTILAGQTSATFSITGVDDAIVDGTQTVTITASAAAHADGTDTLDVTDDDAAALTVSITDAAISENGGTTTATVSRNTDTTNALTVTLVSNDTSEATVIGTVTIAAGQTTSPAFTITGVDDAIVDGTQTVTITASAAAHVDGTDTLDVTDDDAAALTVSITDAAISENGGTTTATVSRNTDTTDALTINLSSNDTGEAGVPATVTILAGQTSATFSITGVDDAIVDGTQTVTITASAAAHADGTDTLDVTDDDAAALTVSITDAAISENGGTTTATVSRNTDTTNALTVTLVSNDTSEATVIGTVTIAAGQTTSPAFDITAVDDAIVDGTQTVTITAQANAHVDGTDTLDVTDDDAAALTVSITDAAISENGGTTTATVSRNTDTTDALTINLSSNDTGEAGVPATVTILAGQTSATFSITGVDDAIVDGTQTVTITASAAAHADGTDTLDVTDDDAAALTVSITDAAISENGGTTTATVSRNTDTTNALTVTLVSNDTSEATVIGTVTIAAGQTTSPAFTITGVDDAIVDGTQTVTITASAAAHTDGTDTLDVTDDDAAALTVSITDAAISENGGTTTGTVSRNTDTTNALTINLSSNDTGEAGVPATVTILAGQTSATFSITGVDDAIVDGTQTVTITASAAAHADGTDTLDVTDDDAAALTVSITDAAISENGGTTTGTVSRNTDTTNALTINLSSNDTGEAGVPATVTILAGQTSATFSITGVDDAIVDGTQTVTITASAAAHTDGTDTLDVTDDDAAALMVSITDAAISENGGTTTGTVSRNTDTTNALTINLSSNDTGEAGVPATVTILAGQTSATFSITGVDDAIVDGTQTVTITASAAAHTDGTDTLDVTDDDAAALTVSITDAAISENGGTTTGTVSRNTDTTNALTINLSSNDTGEAGVPATVTILAGQTSATFSITGVDDAIVDGTQTVTITASAAAHADGTDTLDVTDDESATVGVSAVSNGSESGPVSGQFLVTLSAAAQQDVEVSYTLGGTAVAGEDFSGAATGTVTITAGTLSVPLNIPVIDDRVAEGGADHLSVQLDGVTALGNVSIDTGADTASVLLFDNDFAGIILSKSQVTVSEDATTATFDVVLTSKPTGNVVLNVASSDTGEAAVTDGATLTFTPDNWDTPQPVTVTGVDDGDVDGTQSSIISVSVAGETTADEYTSVPAARLTAKTDDNDATAAATVESITFFNNDADAERQLSVDETGQRSIIRQVEVVVNGEIDVADAAAFALQHLGTGNAVNVTLTASTKAGGRTTILLAFSGTHVDIGGFVGLENGNYELTIDGDALGVTGGEQKTRFHRLYGDSDGDRDVDGADYGNFISALYFGSAGYNSVFDIDNSSTLFDDIDNFFGAFGSVLMP
ncbi:right-handed parallel beta-helix repeat-containing protein [Fuerstiella marisgermanici]|uniref:Calx-beta domain protein n=1 Tax=Fuerstiella marisgermanici TaxID=1891926 RepID=A0A1P8WQR4_9PLAN|nr:Calx-beta domain-containing protein [Fuerstiella marisgermanici]APZ96389.1 Calx-beta domain protein [Fuerstiella marisgermanici]